MREYLKRYAISQNTNDLILYVSFTSFKTTYIGLCPKYVHAQVHVHFLLEEKLCKFKYFNVLL